MSGVVLTKVLEIIDRQPEFDWLGLSKEELLVAIEKESDKGKLFLKICAERLLELDGLELKRLNREGKTLKEKEDKLSEAITQAIENGKQNLLGKRYTCPICGTIALAGKAGTGRVECCGEIMRLLFPEPLPSSD